ncbi:hypothetical protein [Pontibacter fetidus]|uniref:STAS/SEC14 domain-containing protein n=1 Tax=Pontibacter fetidus TaxID=2700082 RepID=A0A6B2H8Q8_9BACT|nr:hypothetical protein [Pontibacter fetidus]NDK55812.1 hypothetical protein [Pontibacter fetidus]
MLLHKDGLIELNYDVKWDVLSVRWPDLNGITISELEFSFAKLIDTLRHYDIKNMLIDTTASKVSEITQEQHLSLLIRFVKLVMTTRLQKLARIETADAGRENVVDIAAEEAINRLGIQFDFRNFSDEVSALEWLKQA